MTITATSDQVRQEISALLQKRLSTELATVSNSGAPCVSYAPYIVGENLNLYVFLSDLAEHTTNLNSNAAVSAMIIEDEAESPNLFARHRLILHCQAVCIPRKSNEFEQNIQRYKERFGAIVDTLIQLADFNLYKLTPSRGVFVMGFGQAFRVDGDNMSHIEHITNPAQQQNQAQK